METFIYFPHNSTTKEPLGLVKADCEFSAIIKAARVKNLDTQTFLSLFKIELYEKRTKI
jgi:hypothetical protein